MDTGKNRIVGKNTKRALKSTLFAVLLSASLSLEGLAAMTADGPGAAYESAGETAENTAFQWMWFTDMIMWLKAAAFCHWTFC